MGIISLKFIDKRLLYVDFRLWIKLITHLRYHLHRLDNNIRMERVHGISMSTQVINQYTDIQFPFVIISHRLFDNLNCLGFMSFIHHFPQNISLVRLCERPVQWTC
ncbi:hypothetical protein CEXT_12201 [Caerostris extrusa]|uniref:Maturase K n=1 Tax=Caerostris extrusa TaxID=172846 RepID=A0AAV4SGV4_CAEEX|nr:hypothetical protein CEXT_12201 [Caerostris extrusa]